MSITLPRVIVATAVEARGPDFDQLADHQKGLLREMARGYGDDCELSSLTTNEILKVLLPHAQRHEKRSFGKMIEVVMGLGGGKQPKCPSLEALPALIERTMMASLIDGWLYQLHEDGAHYPVLLERATFHRADKRAGTPAHVTLVLAKIRAFAILRENIDLDYAQVHGKTVTEILSREELMVETEELKREYEKRLELYYERLPHVGQQYVCTAAALVIGKYNNEHLLNHANDPGGARLVNDHRQEAIRGREQKREPSRVSGNCSWIRELRPDGALIPIQAVIHCFNLGTHQHEWVNAASLGIHDYDRAKKDMLVLPDQHHDLIDALLEQSGADGDVIEGKNAGTIILCMGPAGVGKTLSAEVYSESVAKPLYRVHSGQLGTSASAVEEALGVVTERARAWDAVLLIDEADTYVHERGNDVGQSALVAAFLRTLEYYDGPLFMTTNRYDIDDAIMSRCIAVVRYQLPDAAARRRLWELFSHTHMKPLAAKVIDELVEMFPKASGRDIKLLFSLAKRYGERRGKPLTTDVFRYVGQFRGF